MSRSISRRHFLRAAGLSISTVVFGCGSQTAQPSLQPDLPSTPSPTTIPTVATTPGSSQPPIFREAPMLTTRVQTGQLPPLVERLPLRPLIVPVTETIGEYGGTLRSGIIKADNGAFLRLGRYEGLARWNPVWTDPIPNLADYWEVNETATEYIIVLRSGIHWSDGTPFTAHDIVFPFNYVYSHPQWDGVTEGLDWLFSKQPTVTALDDVTIQFQFAVSHGQFLQWLAAPQGCINLVECPMTYAKQWHPDFTRGLEAQIAAEGFSSWAEFYRSHIRIAKNIRPWERPGIPTLGPWVAVNDLRTENPWVLERNPYYWKVDSAGNQLPYIDYVQYDKVESADFLIDDALTGQWDLLERGLSDSPTYKRRVLEEKKDSQAVHDLIQARMNVSVVAWNLTSPKPPIRAFFNTRKVRQALSVAVDRQMIINEVFNGQGQPSQPAPRPESLFYNEEMMLQYTQYFPEQADLWLDEAGYRRGSDGMRQGPDGVPIVLNIEIFTGIYEQVAPYIADAWAARGIPTMVTLYTDRTEWENVGEQAAYDVRLWIGEGGLYDAIMSPVWYVPGATSSKHMMAWARWYNNGRTIKAGAEEPPTDIKTLLDLWDSLTQTADLETQHALMHEILHQVKEGFYVMGIALPADGVGIHAKRLHNVPARSFDSWIYPNPGPTNPEQYYFAS